MKVDNVPFYEFTDHVQAEGAIKKLHAAGFDVKKLSLVGKGYQSEEHPIGFYTLGDRIKSWGAAGALWGGVWGLLLAPAMFFIPGLGLVALAGPISVALAGALESSVVVGGLSALAAALTRVGLPKEDAIRYETALKADKYVLMVHGTDADRAQVDDVLARPTVMALA